MFDNPAVVVVSTVLIIALSALFVVSEFSLLGARKYRLELEAADSKAARAALKSMNELTVMLAGAQLGITVCTFALGAITKPAVDAWLSPLLQSWGVPTGIASVSSFIIALFFVTFLHLVVGEMAPKSWAIAHPEKSAKFVSIPAQAYIWCVRPLLTKVNSIANRLVAASGVTPVDRAAVGGQDVETIRQLVEHSGSQGKLDASFENQVSQVLELHNLTVMGLIKPDNPPVSVPVTATVGDVQEAVKQSKHMRILVNTANEEPRLVHVRDTLTQPKDKEVFNLSRPAFALPQSTLAYDALSAMRNAGEQLAVVTSEEGKVMGVITVADILKGILPVS